MLKIPSGVGPAVAKCWYAWLGSRFHSLCYRVQVLIPACNGAAKMTEAVLPISLETPGGDDVASQCS